nr:unnamed protein product [Spirometra erinaceieuropaei]
MTADVPDTNRSQWTSLCQLQHSDDTTRFPFSTSVSHLTPIINNDRIPEHLLPPSSVALTTARTTPAFTVTARNLNKQTNINLTAANTSSVDSVHTRPNCDRTSTSQIGLVGHLRIHRTETDEPVPGAPTYIRLVHLH